MATKVLHFTRVLLGRIYIIIYIHIGLCELVILSFYILEHIFFLVLMRVIFLIWIRQRKKTASNYRRLLLYERVCATDYVQVKNVHVCITISHSASC